MNSYKGQKYIYRLVLQKTTYILYLKLEYNIQVLTTEMTGRKPLCIRVQITAVTSSAFYFMPVLCVLYSKTLKR